MFLSLEERVGLDLIDLLDPYQPKTVVELARAAAASPATTRYAIQTLVRAGYVHSKPGPGGGYTRNNLRLLDASLLDIVLLFRKPGASVSNGLSAKVSDLLTQQLYTNVSDLTHIGLKT